MESRNPTNADAGRNAVQALVLELVRSLALEPDAIEVEWVEAERGPVLEIHAEADDAQRLNGERGRTLRSLGLIAKACGLNLGYEDEVRISAEAWPDDADGDSY